MARIQPEWLIRRRLRITEARNDFFQNYQGPPEGTTVRARGASTDVYYRSLNLIDGTEHLVFSTSVLNTTLTVVSAANAGLLTTLPSGDVAQRLRGSGITPSRASWYTGDPSPTYRQGRWGNNVARRYQPNSHRSIPISQATGVFNGADVIERFNNLFGPSGTQRSALGTNGRASLELEHVPISALT